MARVDNFSVIDRKLYFSFVDIFLIVSGCVTTQAVKQNQKLAGEVETQSYSRQTSRHPALYLNLNY